MRINWMVVVVGATLAALRADAQACIPLTAEVAPWRPGLLNTQIDIYNNSCYETEVYSHYLYSQGAAADLVALGDLLNPINASANITIPQDIWWPQFSTGSAGEFRAPNQDCLRYTGDCNWTKCQTGIQPFLTPPFPHRPCVASSCGTLFSNWLTKTISRTEAGTSTTITPCLSSERASRRDFPKRCATHKKSSATTLAITIRDKTAIQTSATPNDGA